MYKFENGAVHQTQLCVFFPLLQLLLYDICHKAISYTSWKQMPSQKEMLREDDDRKEDTCRLQMDNYTKGQRVCLKHKVGLFTWR